LLRSGRRPARTLLKQLVNYFVKGIRKSSASKFLEKLSGYENASEKNLLALLTLIYLKTAHPNIETTTLRGGGYLFKYSTNTNFASLVKSNCG
jgi:hypothetical protein